MRTAHRVALVIAGVACAYVPAASATAAIDPWGAVLRRGEARISLRGAARTEWPLRAAVIARPRGHPRHGQLERVWVRYQAPRHRCSSSFATDRGRSLGTATTRVRTGGDIIARLRGKHRWDRAGRVRFCIWIAPSRFTSTRAATEVLRFSDFLFGAVMARMGSFGDFDFTVESASTVAFRRVENSPCGGNSGVNAERTGTGLYWTGQEALDPACPTSWSFELLVGPPDQRGQGTLRLLDDDESPPRGFPIRHLGACYLTPGFDMADRTVPEAIA